MGIEFRQLLVYNIVDKKDAGIAQLVEQLTRNQ